MTIAPQTELVDFSLTLENGRALLLSLPADEVVLDDCGNITHFRPAGVRRTDRAQVLATRVTEQTSPAYLAVFRQALSLTPAEFAGRIGVTEETVYRWERKGGPGPTAEQVAALEKLRTDSLRAGVVFDGERRD